MIVAFLFLEMGEEYDKLILYGPVMIFGIHYNLICMTRLFVGDSVLGA
jgi:hypothetical protein